MPSMSLQQIKRLVPRPLVQAYHFLFAYLGALQHGLPSRKLHVIGVTGTNGKSSTTEFIGQLLTELGETAGWTSSHSFRVGNRDMVNDKKMGMLGRGQTQALLASMRQHGCEWAVIETSSQGIAQYRHRGIQYDTAVFTNLTPEHIESHGGFENYKQAKLELFRYLARLPRKYLNGHRVPKRVVVNGNDEHARDFASVDADVTISFTREDKDSQDVHTDEVVQAQRLVLDEKGTTATVDGYTVRVPLLGSYYFSNALAAITTVTSLGFDLVAVLEAAKKLTPLPGRLERIEHNGVQIVIDYAPEPYALDALYEAIEPLASKRIIHVGGACGGGRDTWKWSVLGEAAAKRDDIVIVTDEDPYDDDPMMIINAIADACAAAGKEEGKNLFRILDRQEAINKAIALAEPGDTVLLTGKGSEPVMAMANGKHVPWSERKAVEKAIQNA